MVPDVTWTLAFFKYLLEERNAGLKRHVNDDTNFILS